ncbi:helix-turn-helix domain-containing protein [Hymenobacter sp. H14-R3]|uniref:helix-turn-helix domain-containing protein n=1 Tax=Hymenobacter sp. H14-R3 TaxID=3046308 RepID=UPI0024B90B31|nr:helix-turn-helix domain-containing protein [Hymenobacter sp. H14-R3]MDJ0367348.1 helix-turn-helix domain-containing protein [Hymenobacter sp. H14-R3]
MQHVVIIPETEWRQLAARLDRLEQAETARALAHATPPDEVLNVQQAAAYIGLSAEALRRARRKNRIKGVRLNEKEWGFKQSALDAYPRRYHRAAA